MKRHIYMPNEIFEDLRDNIKSAKHVAFAYSYYYYVAYLYRYCEWCKDEYVTQSLIKEALGLSSIEKRVDYIIKKDGVLDTLGYTETTVECPIEWELDVMNSLTFTITSITENGYKIKCPTKCFFRSKATRGKNLLDGTFYDVYETHKINYEVFEKCMDNDELGVNAFFIYSYIKHKNDLFGSYNITLEQIKDEILMSHPTFRKYASVLNDNKLLKIEGDRAKGFKGIANSYKAIHKS